MVIYLYVFVMQEASVRYSAFVRRLVESDLMTVTDLQASFNGLTSRLHGMKQVVYLSVCHTEIKIVC